MKSRSRFLLVYLAVLGVCATTSNAQKYLERIPGVASDYSNDGSGGFYGGGGGLGNGDNTIAPFMTAFNTKFPGRIWAGATIADNGLGYYDGGYFTLGAKTRLFTDAFNGRWLLEARGHLSYESGDVFGNIGIERIFTIDPAQADVGLGIWYDGDTASQGNFSHDFDQIGVSGFLRNEYFELRGNGYIPLEDSGFVLGDPTGANCFTGNSILIQHGLDTALEGFDVELRLRPVTFSMWQGTVDLGAYYYRDPDEAITRVDSFGGFRVRAGVQTLNGVMFQAELNNDDRFASTGFFRIVINSSVFGQYDHLGEDLNPTIRNDHVVKVYQEPVFAVDPRTGLPYRVIHVDNSNTAGSGGSGTAEDPFSSLASADGTLTANSVANDIIFVREGNTPYPEQISLLNGQFLLGDGVAHRIPIVGGTGQFLLCNQIDNNIPTIQSVTLGGNNTVRGFNIQPINGQTGVLANNLVGNVFSNIDQIQIDGMNAPGTNGVAINDSSGSFQFTDSDASNAVGLFINNTLGVAFQVDGDGGGAPLDVDYFGSISNNAVSGQVIRITDTAASSNIALTGGTGIQDTGGAGIFLNMVRGVATITTPQTLINTTAPGVTVQNSGAGATVTFANTSIQNSQVAGVLLNNNPVGSVVSFTDLTISELTGAIGLSATDTAMLNIFGSSSINSMGNLAMSLNGSGPNTIPIGLNATLTSVTSTNSATQGMNFTNVGGLLNIGQLTVTNPTLDGMLVQNNVAGIPILLSNITLANITGTGVAGGAFGNGVRLNATPLSTYNFGTLNIQTDNGNGLFATTAGTINVLGGTITANGGAAIIINPTTFNMNFASAISNNSTGNGIDINGVSGTSALNIATTTINNADGTSILVQNIDDVNSVDGLFDLVANFGQTTITDTAAAPNTDTGISLSNNNTNNALAAGNAQFIFGGLNATVLNGDGLNINNGGTVDFNGAAPTISSTNGTAIDINGSNTTVPGGWVFGNVTSVNSNNEGIRLNNLNNDFTLNGLATITNSAGAGIVAQNTGNSITLANVAINGTGGAGVQASGLTGGTLTMNGGTISNAAANAVNIQNGATAANFNLQNLNILFAATADNQRGIDVQSGAGTVTIANNAVNVNNRTGATGIFVQGNGAANSFNLGTGVSVNNTTSNLGAGSVNFNFNNGPNITGNIEVDGVIFSP